MWRFRPPPPVKVVKKEPNNPRVLQETVDPEASRPLDSSQPRKATLSPGSGKLPGLKRGLCRFGALFRWLVFPRRHPTETETTMPMPIICRGTIAAGLLVAVCV